MNSFVYEFFGVKKRYFIKEKQVDGKTVLIVKFYIFHFFRYLNQSLLGKKKKIRFGTDAENYILFRI